MGKNKSGPKKKAGERYACGKLKPTGDPLAPAAWARIRSDVAKLARDDRLSSEVGRLSLHKELTDAQTTAAFRVGMIYGAFERENGSRRSVRSPSYQIGFGGQSDIAEELLDREVLQDQERRSRAIELAFMALQDELKAWPKDTRDALETLCVDDRVLDFEQLDDVRGLLERLTTFFGSTSSKKKARRTRAKFVPHKSANSTPAPKREDIQKAAWRAFMKAVRPDLTDAQLDESWELKQALEARERFNRTKEKASHAKV